MLVPYGRQRDLRHVDALSQPQIAEYSVVSWMNVSRTKAVGESAAQAGGDIAHSALVVAAVWAVVATVSFLDGRSRFKEIRGLGRTLETFKEIPAMMRPH